jgi:hypothetical protein
MSSVVEEPGSFRDPSSSVFYLDGRVLRGLDERAADDWTALSATTFFPKALADGSVVSSEPVTVADSQLPRDYALVLEHERIPFISYPYEWTFDMLRDAAVLHLELLLAALEAGLTMKDGYSFNVQWRGATPTFIDIGSFERGTGGPWVGYRQFCQTFLYPLMLEAHLGVPFQRFLLGHLDGIEPTEMRAIFGGRRRWKKGVFKNVYLHSVAETRVTKDSEKVRKDLGKAGFGDELAKAAVKKMLKLVRGLRSKRADSGWKAYRETCSYSDADREAKEKFLREVMAGRVTKLAWDLGANDGIYSRIVAEQGGCVIAVDNDDVTVNAMYRSLRADGIGNVLPLVMNLMDPSPARGWRGTERSAFTDRGAPDLVLALALVHHLAIGSNVPLPEVVSWLRSIGGTLVVEFVEPHDPMAERLLANKRAGLFPDYRIDAFEAELAKHYTIERTVALPGGSRTLFVAEPR